MEEKFEEIKKIGTSAVLTVSARGTGLYLYIPKRMIEVFGIKVGDRLEVEIKRHYRPKEHGTRSKKDED